MSNYITALQAVLADSYTLFLKTQNYHWNVEGPHFQPLHGFFEEIYTDLFEAVDTLAERIRTRNAHAPASFSALSKMSAIQDDEKHMDATSMLKQALKDQETLIQILKDAEDAADEADDLGTEDLLVERLRVHEKTVWMLRAFLVK